MIWAVGTLVAGNEVCDVNVTQIILYRSGGLHICAAGKRLKHDPHAR